LENYTYHQAAVDLSLIVVGLKPEINEEIIWQSDLVKKPVKIPKAYFINQSYRMFRYRKMPTFFSRIIKKSIYLRDISKISCGLEYGALLKTNFLSSTKTDSTWYPVIDGSNGIPDQYVLFWIPGLFNSYVRYDKKYEEHLIDSNQNISNTGKRVIIISGNINRFQKDKILIRQTSPRFIAALDTNNYLSLRNIHVIYLAKSPYTLKMILGVINSSFGNWIGEYMNVIRKGGKNRYPQIRVIIFSNIERKVSECTKIGNKISTDLVSLWEITSKLNMRHYKTQRQHLQKYLSNNISTSLGSIEADDCIQRIRNNLKILFQIKEKINDNVFDLYGLTEGEKKEIL
jgi:hypothetical protein